MTFVTALSAAGHYLFLGVGLIILLILIVLAAVFIATLFMRLHGEIRIRAVNSSPEGRILVYFKMPFFRYDLVDFDNLDEEDEITEDGPDQSVCHVTIKDEHITFRTTEAVKHSDAYEIIIHTQETVKTEIDASGPNGGIKTVSDVYESETEEILHVSADEREFTDIAEGTDEQTKTTVIDFEYEAGNTAECLSPPIFETDSAGGAYDSDDAGSTDDAYDSADSSGFDYEKSSEDLRSSLEEIRRYVDLSDPSQFVSDSLSAASKMSKALARFVGDLLLRTDIRELSADVIYGLSDPADTALSYGGIHSFKASLYAYFIHAGADARSSKTRRKADQLAVILRDDVLIVPDLSQKTAEGEFDLVFSFWIPRLYIPAIRLLLNKNTRWILRRYVYPYYLRHYYRTQRAERRKSKEDKKGPNPDYAASGSETRI